MLSAATASCRMRIPVEREPKLASDLVELTDLDASLVLDIRYASANNFVGFPVYQQARAFLQRPAAEALVRVQKKLAEQGLGLVIFDGYRPWSVTRLFWQVTPVAKRNYVADPSKGSRHNRGCAVDCALMDLQTGRMLPFPSEYDDFSEKAHLDYQGSELTEQQIANRSRLLAVMQAEGFQAYPYEWWHFDYQDWQAYPLLDTPFEKLD